MPSPYALSVLDAVWRCVLPDARSRAQFLALDGLDGLFTFLECGNKHTRWVLHCAFLLHDSTPRSSEQSAVGTCCYSSTAIAQ